METTPSRLELSPLNFLHRNAQALGERPAVVHGERRLNYAELEERCNRLASALRDRGLERHDRVAILAPNSPALLEAHYGVPLAGAVLVAMNTRLGSEEIEYILRDSGAKILLVDAELKDSIDSIDLDGIETVVIDDSGEPDDPYEELLASGSSEAPESWLEDENEPISINYTSGTTGRPKGAIYTHRGAYLRALGVALEIKLGYDSVHLWTLPMFHCNGWCLTWAVTAGGGVHVCLRKVEPERIWELLRRRRCDALQRGPDDSHEHRQSRERPSAGAAGDRSDGRLAASAGTAQADARPQSVPDSSLWPDGDLWPGDGLQLAAAVG